MIFQFVHVNICRYNGTPDELLSGTRSIHDLAAIDYFLRLSMMYEPYRSLQYNIQNGLANSMTCKLLRIVLYKIDQSKLVYTSIILRLGMKKTHIEYLIASMASFAGRNSFTATSLFSFFLSVNAADLQQLD